LRRLAVVCALAAVSFFRVAHAADEIHWTLTGPTSVTFDWRGSSSDLRYGLTSGYGSTATGATPNPLPLSSPGPFWEAKLTGLQPNTIYHYSLSSGPDHLFHTMPLAGSNFTVYVEGDVGDTSSYPRVGPVQSLIASGAPSLVLVVGDLTYADGAGQSAVDNHFNNVMKWSQDAAYMPAWGNHDWEAPDDLRNYKGRFEFPNPQTSPNAPSAGCCGEDWSWFDCGNTRFISYPEPYTGAWSDWNTHATTLMDAAQADPTIRFIVTFGHRPAYSSGYHPGDPQLQGYLDALGDSHSKYVLNLNGHSHDYERSNPQHGVTHVTVGIGGSDLEEASGTCIWPGGCPPPSWSAFRAFHHGSLRLRFSPTSIHGDAMCGPAGDSGSNLNDITCTYGSVFDSFLIGADSTTGVPSSSSAPALAIESVAPNPSRSPLTVVYLLPGVGPANLELVDVAGRRWLHEELGSPGPGRHETTLPLSKLPGPGVFWIHLKQSGRHVFSKVVLVL